MLTRVYLTPPQVAKSRGVNVRKILAAINSGQLIAVDWASPGSSRPAWRISPEALAAYESKRSNQPATQPARRKSRLPVSIPQFV